MRLLYLYMFGCPIRLSLCLVHCKTRATQILLLLHIPKCNLLSQKDKQRVFCKNCFEWLFEKSQSFSWGGPLHTCPNTYLRSQSETDPSSSSGSLHTCPSAYLRSQS